MAAEAKAVESGQLSDMQLEAAAGARGVKPGVSGEY
jgi:hypothetical protein